MAEAFLFGPGDTITAVNGRAVEAGQYFVLVDELQKAAGKPLPVTVSRADGKSDVVMMRPHFDVPFGGEPVDFAGLQMLAPGVRH